MSNNDKKKLSEEDVIKLALAKAMHKKKILEENENNIEISAIFDKLNKQSQIQKIKSSVNLQGNETKPNAQSNESGSNKAGDSKLDQNKGGDSQDKSLGDLANSDNKDLIQNDASETPQGDGENDSDGSSKDGIHKTPNSNLKPPSEEGAIQASKELKDGGLQPKSNDSKGDDYKQFNAEDNNKGQEPKKDALEDSNNKNEQSPQTEESSRQNDQTGNNKSIARKLYELRRPAQEANAQKDTEKEIQTEKYKKKTKDAIILGINAVEKFMSIINPILLFVLSPFLWITKIAKMYILTSGGTKEDKKFAFIKAFFPIFGTAISKIFQTKKK